MNISEVELKTGITKQNIRFYEKKGLLHPKRNEENSYREYTDEDVETLIRIKIFRKLDLPIEDIRRIFEGDDKNAILNCHLEYLLHKKSDLDAAISMCRFMLHMQSDSMDIGMLNRKMEDMERKGGHFMAIISDYKKIAKAEGKKQFSFSPDNMALTPQEFTEALCRYGEENHLNLVVTEEGMYPKFEIDGLEYEAQREFGRFGAVIRCNMTHPELIDEDNSDIPEKSRRIYRAAYRLILNFAIPVGLFVYFCFGCRNFMLAVYMELIYMAIFYFWFRNFRIR